MGVDYIIYVGDMGCFEIVDVFCWIVFVMVVCGNVDSGKWVCDYFDMKFVCLVGKLIYVLYDLKMLKIDFGVGFDVIVFGYFYVLKIDMVGGIFYLNFGSVGFWCFKLLIMFVMFEFMFDGM